jgi:hypothetical protein
MIILLADLLHSTRFVRGNQTQAVCNKGVLKSMSISSVTGYCLLPAILYRQYTQSSGRKELRCALPAAPFHYIILYGAMRVGKPILKCDFLANAQKRTMIY